MNEEILKIDYTRFNHQVQKTQKAGELLNYYGDLIMRIEYAIKNESVIKEIPKKVKDVLIFKNLVYNKTYSNIFGVKLNNIHNLASEFEHGFVYLEKLTMSNRSKWLKKHFKNEIKLFESTYKEVVIKSYFDLTDRNVPVKYDIIFNFNGVDPNNERKFNEINSLTKEKVDVQELYQILNYFISITEAEDIKVISKAQLLDLIEESVKNNNLL